MSNLCFNFLFMILHATCIFTKQCDWKYYQHYAQKSCKPVIDENDCPVRFLCEPQTKEMLGKCFYKGMVYNNGENIKDLDTCNSCFCYTDENGDASIECASKECPYFEHSDKSCYMGYLPEQCCPTEICPLKNEKLRNACIHNGRVYHIGQNIMTEDKCQLCICTGAWNGKENGPGCKKVDCLTGIFAKHVRRGCLPIYGEDYCCPTEIECGNVYGAKPVDHPKGDKSDLCIYQGAYYTRGSVVFLVDDSYLHITCKCSVPPDFTCIKKAT